MVALGQKQTFAAHKSMSALPSKADMCGAKRDVRLVPIADIWPGLFWLGLFDHLIGALLHLQRHIEAQSLRGLGVDH